MKNFISGVCVLLFTSLPSIAFEARILKKIAFPAHPAPILGWKHAYVRRPDGSMLVTGFGYSSSNYPLWLISPNGEQVTAYAMEARNLISATLSDGSSLLLLKYFEENPTCTTIYAQNLIKSDLIGKMSPFTSDPSMCGMEVVGVTAHEGKVYVSLRNGLAYSMVIYDELGNLLNRVAVSTPNSRAPISPALPQFFPNGFSVFSFSDGLAIFDSVFQFLSSPTQLSYSSGDRFSMMTESGIAVEAFAPSDVKVILKSVNQEGKVLSDLVIDNSHSDSYIYFDRIEDTVFNLKNFGLGFLVRRSSKAQAFFRVADDGLISSACKFDTSTLPADDIWSLSQVLKDQTLVVQVSRGNKASGELLFLDLHHCKIKGRLPLYKNVETSSKNFEFNEQFLDTSGYDVFLIGVKH